MEKAELITKIVNEPFRLSDKQVEARASEKKVNMERRVGACNELLMLSGRIVERVRMVLENRFELVLSDAGVPLHQPITRFYSEEAGELVKLETMIVENVGAREAYFLSFL